jgi:hypothetical protein
MANPTGANSGGTQQQQRSAVPFLAGSWEYSEWMAQDSLTMGNSTEYVHQITPGGFLRGITFSLTSASGVLGTTASLVGDSPWSVIQSMTLESIDGTPILYPMLGYSYYLVARYCRPWDGDPAADGTTNTAAVGGYQNTINPFFRLRFFVEGRITIGVLPNTDARAQYRLRYTVAPLLQPAGSSYGLVSTTTTGVTAPVLTFNLYLETYAQPPQVDYSGNPIVQIPDGLTLQRFVSHQAGDNTNTGTFTIKENRVGNLIRTLLLVVRNSVGVRTDLTADPIRWRLDNTQLLSEYRDRRDFEMDRFGSQQNARLYNSNKPTGLYVYFRYHNPGQMDGNYWLPTTEASYLQFELNGGPSSGTLESVTEDLAPAGPVPSYLQGL